MLQNPDGLAAFRLQVVGNLPESKEANTPAALSEQKKNLTRLCQAASYARRTRDPSALGVAGISYSGNAVVRLFF